ncbi:hypothetical protein [Bacillus sp. HMF5848]|nr:hypothetical protein [Bacillus sp. HMF5848]
MKKDRREDDRKIVKTKAFVEMSEEAKELSASVESKNVEPKDIEAIEY